jgi:peptide/nickel transport system permease protein
MLEVIRQDFIRTARAKGLSERLVVYRHALRNSLIPIITLMANLLPALIGGSIVIEMLFTIPGMGQLSYQSVQNRDYPVIMAIFTLSALLTLIGILLADFLYTIVDPRIAYEKRAAG